MSDVWDDDGGVGREDARGGEEDDDGARAKMCDDVWECGVMGGWERECEW